VCNTFAGKAIERSAEARSAEALRKGEARRAEPTFHSVYAEARRAEGRGPKGRGEILGVVNFCTLRAISRVRERNCKTPRTKSI